MPEGASVDDDLSDQAASGQEDSKPTEDAAAMISLAEQNSNAREEITEATRTVDADVVTLSVNLSEPEAITPDSIPASKEDGQKQSPAIDTNSKDEQSRKKIYPKVDMMLGDFVAEGGFCSIWEVSTIKDLNTGNWILAPTPSTTTSFQKGATGKAGGNHHHRKGSSAFGSLGALAMGLASPVSSKASASRNHKRGLSSPAGVPGAGGIALPPSMKSVDLTVVRKFQDVSTVRRISKHGKANRSASMSSSDTNSNRLANMPSGKDAKSSMRRSISLLGSSRKDGSGKRMITDTSTEGGYRHDKTQEEIQGPRYVLKCIKTKSFQKAEYLKLALKDMKIEIEMLQRIQHPHIISLKAFGTMEIQEYLSDVGKRDAEANAKSNLTDDIEAYSDRSIIPRYPFVILDRLGETLTDKLQQWETKHRKLSSVVGKMITHRNHSKASFCLSERLNVLCNLASALEYLHCHRIAYRDLKPENIGFVMQQDELKLLDFGLCKDLSRLKANSSGLFNLTVLTGSARYMAPEVAREDPYNESCDTYGLAIVIWQVMALEKPYAKFNVSKMFQQVYDCPHVRPSLEEWGDSTDPSHPLKWLLMLLRRMWSPLVEDRPSIKKVHATLNNQFLKQQQLFAKEGRS